MGSYLMDIKQVARFFNDIGVETVATDTSIRPEIDYGVNYYKLILNNSNNKWEFLYVPHERRSSGGEEIRKFFYDEASASKYYYLHELSTHYLDRKSTRLNSSHVAISYAVFCLKKKKQEKIDK